MTTASEYRSQLQDNICEVVFTKKNGQPRTLIGTLRQDLIESNNLVPVGGGHPGPENQIRLIDLTIKEWRSFDVNSVISFKVIEEVKAA
jgi:hypothetical protein